MHKKHIRHASGFAPKNRFRKNSYVTNYIDLENSMTSIARKSKHFSALNGALATGCKAPGLYGKKHIFKKDMKKINPLPLRGEGSVVKPSSGH